MNRRRALTYLNCFCCSRTHSVEDLIEMSSNSLQVCEQMVDFHDLILDVCSVKLNSNIANYICLDCKERLVQFHVFKKNVKGYSDFGAHVKTCDTLLKLEPLLMDCEQVEELQSVKYGVNVVMLAPVAFHERYEAFEKTLAEHVLKGSLPKQETFDQDVMELDKSMSEGPEDELLHLVSEETLTKETAPIDEKIDKKRKCVPPASTSKTEKKAKRTSLPSKSHRWNTNESLTPQQKAWINKEAVKGTTQSENWTFWKCSQCDKKLSSSWVLRKHLRDVHILSRPRTEKV